MRKRQGILSVLLVVSLLWCAIPVFAGWSWCGSDPIFVITGEDGQEVDVSVDIPGEFLGEQADFSLENVEVKLIVPAGVAVAMSDDGGFTVKVNADEDRVGDVKVQVKATGQACDEYLLQDLTVTVNGASVDPKKASDSLWMFEFDLP